MTVAGVPAAGTTRRPALGLVADDLTGAADSAAGFADQGWQVHLHLTPSTLAGASAAPGTVLAVTTGVRAAGDEDAATATAGAVGALAAAGVDRLYVKVDSTVRGSVAGQVSGALAAWTRCFPGASAVICPAFPSQGRTVVDGVVLVHGVPVAETAAATDPVTPRTDSDLTTIILGARTGRSAAAGSMSVLDAVTEADLDAVVTDLRAGGPETVLVGSGGLAAALGRSWPAASTRRARPAADGAVLIAVSSLHPATARQLDRLRRLGHTDAVDVLTTGTQRLSPVAAAAAFADRVVDALATRSYAALVLVGGDGAAAVLARLGAYALDLDGTLLAGCPTGTITGGTAGGLRTVTKSGGFGDADTLSTIITRLRAGSRPDHDDAAPRPAEKERS